MKTVLAIILITAGCSTRQISLPNGTTYKSFRLGVKEDFADIQFTQTTNGAAALRVQGLKSDLVTGFAAGVDAAINAVGKAAK